MCVCVYVLQDIKVYMYTNIIVYSAFWINTEYQRNTMTDKLIMLIYMDVY